MSTNTIITLQNILIILVLITTLFAIFNTERLSLTTTFVSVRRIVGPRRLPQIQIKPHNRWIVVTSINPPTDDVKRLASTGWNLVVVADKKTPKDWFLEGVHFLSVEDQQNLGLLLPNLLPYGTYTRKNIGYLYAIKNGAEWIYDTDDDNKPYGLGLKQFTYEEETYGLRWQPVQNNSLSTNVFNPYSYFGNPDMWPRGFPLEFISNHSNGVDRMILCRKMKTSVVQQGLVHKDPDVDAIYRLLHAHRKTGLNEQFEPHAAPVTLDIGTFAPWNSQNTLFHRKAFFTLFLPASVEFRAVYLKSGKIIELLETWSCTMKTIEECTIELAERFRDEQFWQNEDVDLVRAWITDLKSIGYEFPQLALPTEYKSSDSKDCNCHRVHLDFSQNRKKKTIDSRIQNFEDLLEFCEDFGDMDNASLPLTSTIEEHQMSNTGLVEKSKTALIMTANWPWQHGIGVLQRLYEPYFAVIIFCGTWNETQYSSNKTLPTMRKPFNYIHLSQDQIYQGYFEYYCLSKARDLKLQNIEGYYLVADDTIFNPWVSNPQNISNFPDGHRKDLAPVWWTTPNGKEAANNTLSLITYKYANDFAVQKLWKEFNRRVRLNGHNKTGTEVLTEFNGRSASDFMYVPSYDIDFVADMFELFSEGKLFLETATAKIIHAMNFTKPPSFRYLWNDERDFYEKTYNAALLFMHPIKLGPIENNKNETKKFCETIVKTFNNNMYS